MITGLTMRSNSFMATRPLPGADNLTILPQRATLQRQAGPLVLRPIAPLTFFVAPLVFAPAAAPRNNGVRNAAEETI